MPPKPAVLMLSSLALVAMVTLTACGGDAPAAEETSAASTSSPPSATSSSPTTRKAPAPTTSAAATPEQEFHAAMRTSGVIPQYGTEADTIKLATSICVAYGSGKSFLEEMNTLAGGSMSLDQMIDLNQAATQHYCPQLYIPEP